MLLLSDCVCVCVYLRVSSSRRREDGSKYKPGFFEGTGFDFSTSTKSFIVKLIVFRIFGGAELTVPNFSMFKTSVLSP